MMDTTVSCIEEIPRKDLLIPQIRLKIIHLNLDERGRSLTPPLPSEGSVVQRYVRQPLPRKHLHQLKSYGHLLSDPHHYQGVGSNGCPRKKQSNGALPSQNSLADDSTYSRNVGSHSEENGNKYPLEDESVYVIFMKGMNNFQCIDKDKILSTIVQLVNNHAVSVATKEYSIFNKQRGLSPKSTLNHFLVQSALLVLNELVDEGVLDISRRDVAQLGQCITFSLYFHKTLQQLGRSAWHSAWHSAFSQIIRDAWMSFGCLGAVFIISAMRQ
ncbi:hypothetical protein Hamer_G024378 [Homarus americanus]|uniref:Uncharacterized protein n=1 Tax=Homarus americanus TaxID=6706 RepID=A0A8J5MKX9_HOMAM|nr:hypothetical protein Hamer_G024378 [Homarus americanus]